ncbi:MAG: TIM barrel protein, partial [Candidatus Rokubacteria bacterium]|nr:TIM barrel protein [Candidatus Rokubacteria bacterium]
MNAIGIMQGRLLPPRAGRIQSFPADAWAEEFPRAAAAGLACIEWIYDLETAEANPLASAAGLERVRAAARAHGVGVRSVCADYFMDRPLVRAGRADAEAWARLRWLIARCAAIGVGYIVLPF